MNTDISFDASAVEEAFIEHYGIKVRLVRKSIFRKQSV